jgi:hypothetical protein
VVDCNRLARVLPHVEGPAVVSVVERTGKASSVSMLRLDGTGWTVILCPMTGKHLDGEPIGAALTLVEEDAKSELGDALADMVEAASRLDKKEK